MKEKDSKLKKYLWIVLGIFVLIIGIIVYILLRNEYILEPFDIEAKYQYNPIELIKNEEENTYSIKGLKNKETSDELNKTINSSYRESKMENPSCKITFNFNNIMSYNCDYYFKTFNLVNGKKVKLEDIIIDMDSLYDMIQKKYKDILKWNSDSGKVSDNDAETEKYIKKIKNNEYELYLNNDCITIGTDLIYDAYFYYYEIEDLISFTKFKTKKEIYEEEITNTNFFYNEYWEIKDNYRNTKDIRYYYRDLLNSKTYVNYEIFPAANDIIGNENIFDATRTKNIMDDIIKLIVEETIESSTYYQKYDILAYITDYTPEMSQLIITADYYQYINSADFYKVLLGASIGSDVYDNKIVANILIDKNDNIIYLKNNPKEFFSEEEIEKISAFCKFDEEQGFAIGWAIDEDTREANYYGYLYDNAGYGVAECKYQY